MGVLPCCRAGIARFIVIDLSRFVPAATKVAGRSPLQSKKRTTVLFSSFQKEPSMTAEYKVHGDVAVITMNNPPVNGLGYATRVGLTNGIEKANADPAVKSIVVTGAGKA